GSCWRRGRRKARPRRGGRRRKAGGRNPRERETKRSPPATHSPGVSRVGVNRGGKSPPATAATRRLANPRPVQGEQGPPRGCPPRARVAAKRDDHPRQNPAYRPATGKALETGLFLWVPTRLRLVGSAPAVDGRAVRHEPSHTFTARVRDVA